MAKSPSEFNIKSWESVDVSKTDVSVADIKINLSAKKVEKEIDEKTAIPFPELMKSNIGWAAMMKPDMGLSVLDKFVFDSLGKRPVSFWNKIRSMDEERKTHAERKLALEESCIYKISSHFISNQLKTETRVKCSRVVVRYQEPGNGRTMAQYYEPYTSLKSTGGGKISEVERAVRVNVTKAMGNFVDTAMFSRMAAYCNNIVMVWGAELGDIAISPQAVGVYKPIESQQWDVLAHLVLSHVNDRISKSGQQARLDFAQVRQIVYLACTTIETPGNLAQTVAEIAPFLPELFIAMKLNMHNKADMIKNLEYDGKSSDAKALYRNIFNREASTIIEASGRFKQYYSDSLVIELLSILPRRATIRPSAAIAKALTTNNLDDLKEGLLYSYQKDMQAMRNRQVQYLENQRIVKGWVPSSGPSAELPPLDPPTVTFQSKTYNVAEATAELTLMGLQLNQTIDLASYIKSDDSETPKSLSNLDASTLDKAKVLVDFLDKQGEGKDQMAAKTKL